MSSVNRCGICTKGRSAVRDSMKNIVYFNGKFIERERAHVPLATHALHYGTGCFEGIRGYFNKDCRKLYVFRMCDHYLRMQRSSRMLHLKLPMDVGQLCDVTVELLRRNVTLRNVYIRPICYKREESITTFNLDALADGFAIFVMPLEHALPVSRGIRVITSQYLRVDARMVPPEAKPTGMYFNTCLAKTEAEARGADDAIFLNADGTVAEASGANIFLVKDGSLHTPSITQNIVHGITRQTIIEIARRELALETIERPIQKEELFEADELFLTGTGVEVVSIGEIDGVLVKGGAIGPVTAMLQTRYFTITSGKDRRYARWLTVV